MSHPVIRLFGVIANPEYQRLCALKVKKRSDYGTDPEGVKMKIGYL